MTLSDVRIITPEQAAQLLGEAIAKVPAGPEGPRGPAGADSTVAGPEGPRGPAGSDAAATIDASKLSIGLIPAGRLGLVSSGQVPYRNSAGDLIAVNVTGQSVASSIPIRSSTGTLPGIGTPTLDGEAAPKKYVDDKVAAIPAGPAGKDSTVAGPQGERGPQGPAGGAILLPAGATSTPAGTPQGTIVGYRTAA